MSICWYFMRAELVQTFVTIPAGLGRFFGADGEAELCSKWSTPLTDQQFTTSKVARRMLLSVYSHITITYNALEQVSWAWAIPTATLLLHDYTLIVKCALANIGVYKHVSYSWTLQITLIHTATPLSCCMHILPYGRRCLYQGPGHVKQHFEPH